MMHVGTLGGVDDDGSIRRGTVSFMGRKNAPIVLVTPYGLIHNPPSGSMVTVFGQGGKASNLIGIADDPASRSQSGLASGEVGLENYMTGTFIVFKENGDIEISCENDVRVVKAKNVTANVTETVNITCPSITMNGDVVINGALTQSGGGAVSMSGNISANGTITANGVIESTSDVITGAISLNSHLHSGVTPGGANTGGPV